MNKVKGNNPQGEQAQHATDIATRKIKQKAITDLLELYKGSIANSLPSMVTPERFIRSVLSACYKDSRLLDCTAHSFMGSVLTIAQLGLMPDGVTGEAHLIPVINYEKNGLVECTYMIGYKGLCTLAYRSMMVQSIQAKPVYEGDVFEYQFGLNEKLNHIPMGLTTDPSKITHFYSIVRMVNGGISFDVMTAEAVNKVRDESDNYSHSANKENEIWHRAYADMGCKTVLRRNMKYAPFSAEISKALALDFLADVGKQNAKMELLNDVNSPEELIDATLSEEIFEDKKKVVAKKDSVKTSRSKKVSDALDNLENQLKAKKK